jgi:FKBP-type peptidyl-prolyl cis-trans isomerase
MKKITFFALLCILALAACKQEPTLPKNVQKGTQAAVDDGLIQDYLKKSALTGFKNTDSGIYYKIEKEGTGDVPADSWTVKVHYEGKLLDGKVFDSSIQRGEPVSFPLGNVIVGWRDAVKMLKTGGKGTFILPSGLAYGPQGGGPIPPNSVLVFSIELLEGRDQAQADDAAIKEYIQKNNLKMERTPTGIYYTIEKPGTGAAADINSKVKVHYHGTLFDGTVFDSSVERKQPAEFPLKGVIPGWQQAVPLLKVGGKGKFIIPSALAYGPRPAGKISPNSNLIFDIELLEVGAAEAGATH